MNRGPNELAYPCAPGPWITIETLLNQPKAVGIVPNLFASVESGIYGLVCSVRGPVKQTVIDKCYSIEPMQRTSVADEAVIQ